MGPTGGRSREGWGALGLSLLLLGLFAARAWSHGSALAGFPLDDGWIHQVYARGLATTGVPAYNPGQPESGMTSPLWVVLTAALWWPGHLAGLPPALLPKGLSLVLGALAGTCVWGLLRRSGASRALALGAACVLSLDPDWAFAAASGMEVTLCAALLLGATWGVEEGRWRRAGLLLGLAAVTRPEALVPALGLALAGPVLPGTAGARLRILLSLLLPTVLLFGAWVAYNLWATGYPLPNTFYAKARSGLPPWTHLQAVAAILLLKASFHRWILGAVLGAMGVLAILRADRLRAMVLVPGLLLAALVLAHRFPQPWPFYWLRYLLPLWPFLVLWMGRGLVPLEALLQGATARALALGVALVATAGPGLGTWGPTCDRYLANCENVERGNVAVGRWIRDHTPPDARVATEDAGAVRYFGERETLDLLGLNAFQIVHHRDQWEERVDAWNPGWFVLFPGHMGMVVEGFGLQPVLEVDNRPFTLCDCPAQERVGVYRVPGPPESR